MYLLARLFLIGSVILMIYSLAVGLALISPLVLLIAVGLVMAGCATRKGRQLTAFGTARWGDEADMRHAGMIGASKGLILGRTAGYQTPWQALKKLFNPKIAAAAACIGLLESVKGKKAKTKGEVVRLPHAVHTAVFAPTGVGKGVSCIVPFLLTEREPCVTIDLKAGENARLVARHRAKRFGHRVAILDPMKLVTNKPDTLNVLDFIDKDSEFAIEDCRDLGKAWVVRTGQEKDPHWCDAAELWIAAMAAVVVQYAGKEKRSLQAVRDILTNPQKMAVAMKLLQESEAASGMLARLGGQLSQFQGDELGSVLTSTNRFMNVLDSPAMLESTSSSSFDLNGLCDGNLDLFIVAPPERQKTLTPWLRMAIGAALRAVMRRGLQEKHQVHFLLDEAASLGQMDQISDILATGRGYGIRLQFYYQSQGQLKQCYPLDGGQCLLSNTTKVFFGVNDVETADLCSRMLGEETIVVNSGGASNGGSRSWTQGGQHSVTGGSSWNQNSNWAQQARKLLKPEEIMNLPLRTAITFAPGSPPIWTTLLRYYEEGWLFRPAGWIGRQLNAFKVLVRSLLLLVVALCLAGMVTEMAAEQASAAKQKQAQQQQVPQFDFGAHPKGSAFHP